MAEQSENNTQLSSRSRQLCLQDDVLKSKHPQLREKLNFRSIFPHLNSHGLLPHSLDLTRLVDDKTTQQERIDAIITHVPECGKDDYLDKFIECLRDSEADAGDAHSELAETLQTAYTKLTDPDYTSK